MIDGAPLSLSVPSARISVRKGTPFWTNFVSWKWCVWRETFLEFQKVIPQQIGKTLPSMSKSSQDSIHSAPEPLLATIELQFAASNSDATFTAPGSHWLRCVPRLSDAGDGPVISPMVPPCRIYQQNLADPVFLFLFCFFGGG